MIRIDYDKVAPLYDEPLRDHGVDPRLTSFLRERGDAVGTRTRVLDVGCGTGKQLAANRERFPVLRLVYRYFPAALERDEIDFIPAETLLAWMREAGFSNVRVERHTTADDVSLREFLAYASSRHRASQFTAISDEDYAAGLRRLELSVTDDPDAAERSAFCLATFIGDR